MSLIHIREFLRKRTEAIEEVYEEAFTDSERRAQGSDLENLSEKGKPEKLKPLSKLLLIYKRNSHLLLNAFYLQIWRSRPTYAEYEADKPFDQNAATVLDASTGKWLRIVKAALSKEEIRIVGIHPLPDSTIVVVLLREFHPTIKRDFREEYNVHFGCGIIVFGVSADHKRLVIKTGNARLTDALKLYFEDEFQVKLKSTREQVFSDYDAKELEKVFLGGYKEDSPIQITAADFRHSGLTSRCPLSVHSYGATKSIQPDLKELAESKTIQLRSLDDLASLTVFYEGMASQVSLEVSFGGAAILGFDDRGWADDQRKSFEEEFLKTFGIPVNKYIDPQKFELGGVRVIASLLSITDEDSVQPYQQEKYEELLEAGILSVKANPARVCRSLICRPKKPILDEKSQVCSKCDQPIEDSVIREVKRNQTRIAEWVSAVLEPATGFSFDKTKQFEGLEYYPLSKKGHPESETICVIIDERLSKRTKLTFQRSSQALTIIESYSDERYIYLDEEGIGHISLAYLYTAQQSEREKDNCANLCRKLVKALLVHHQERVAKAARISYQHMIGGTIGDKGNVYETEVFNVLRSILPYCYQFGREGKIEPDGYVCLPVYEQQAMEGVATWNWSYDAKHSDKSTGYDLTIEERRKIVNYIEKFRAKIAFWDESTKLRAHVIISNKLSEAKMKRTSEFVFDVESGVKKTNRDVRLVLMQQEFMTRLYELVTEKRDEYQRRRPYFGNLLVELLGREGPDGYTLLDKQDADRLFEKLLKLRPLEKAMTESELLSGLE